MPAGIRPAAPAVDQTLGLAVTFVLALGAGACAAAQVPLVTDRHVRASQVRWPDVSRNSLERGRELYLGRCATCHALELPASLPASRWPDVLAVMTRRARLGPVEARLVERYIITFAR